MSQDQSASAYSGNRGPGLERATEHAARLAPCALIVQHSDRLARGDHKTAKHLLWYALWALEHDVELRSVQDPQTFGDLLYTAVTGQRNHEDSKRKSAAVRSGKRRRFERGDSTGPLQFGYRLVKVIGEDNHVVTTRAPEPDEPAVVMEMYRLLDRGLGIGDITRWVNGQGVRTKRGRPFGRSRVREILSSPWYGGKVRSQGEVREGNHEARLPWDEWQGITAKLSRPDPSSVAKRRGGRPSDVALLSGVMFCAHCGGGIWHRKNGAQRHYVCGNVRHATGACDARRFDARQAEEAVAAHLGSIFVDFASWLDNLTRERAVQRDGLVRELAALHDRLAGLQRDEDLIRADYVKRLRAGNDAAANVAATELDRIAAERTEGTAALTDLDARLAEWDGQADADGALDWWNDFSAAVRGEVVNAESIRDANAALRERFAGIYVTCGNTPKTGKATFTTRFDFILKDEQAPVRPFWLHFTGDGAELRGTLPDGDDQTGRLTLVHACRTRDRP